jgi:ubiquinone biosynthesis protein COQ9
MQFNLNDMQNIEQIKSNYVDLCLKNVVFDGWNESTFVKAAKQLNQPENYGYILFPAGIIDVANYFNRQIDTALVTELAHHDLANTRIKDKIHLAIFTRIKLLNPHKAAIRRMIGLYTMPHNIMQGAGSCWNVADIIWQTLMDKSVDINYYTKRIITCSVYSSTIMFWLEDRSIGNIDTFNFLTRKINDALKIGKIKQSVTENIKKIPFIRLLYYKFM